MLNILDTNEARTYLNRVDINGELYEHVVYLLDGQTYREEDVLEGEKIIKPADPIENFGGWFTDPKYTNLYNYNNPVTKDLILYGKTTQKYNVEFYDKNPETGDETLYTENEVPAGDPVDEPEDHPNHTGYDFDYWCTVDNVKYIFSTPVTEDLKLITCYTIQEFDVNFYNYQDTIEKTIEVEYKNLIDQTEAPTFDETGYTFICWTTDKENCFDFTTPITSNIDLYPKHEKLKNAVVFNDENRITTVEVPYGDTTNPIDNQGKEGHTFRCWSEDRTNCFDFDTPIIQNTTVYAIYDINHFTVSFIDRDPEEIEADVPYGDAQIVEWNGTVTKPTLDPTHTGYTFSEWTKEDGTTYNFETPVTSDLVLISNYDINSYPVRFHDGSDVTTVSVEYKHKVTPIESPTKEHNIFTGWLKNDTLFDFDTLIVEETDLYSSYEEVLAPKISHTPTMWTNGNVTVTVEKNDSLVDDTGYSYLYKTQDSTYSTYENPFVITENTTIIAKSVKQDVDSVVSNREIRNIDKLNPSITLFSENTVNKNSVTLNVSSLDNESGINYYEVYQDNVKIGEKHFECYSETDFDSYEECRSDLPAEREDTYTATGLSPSTTYTFKVKVYDKAGNYVLSDDLEVTTTEPYIVARLIGYNNEPLQEENYINFESLAEAFAYGTNSGDLYDCQNVQCTIQMVRSTNESVQVLNTQDLTLDLNGKIVSGVNSEYTIKNNGDFTLIDSTPENEDEGKIVNTLGTGIYNKAGSNLTLGQGYSDREVPDSVVSVTRPYIYGEHIGIKNETNGNLTFFDGIVVSKNTTIQGEGAINGEVTGTEYSYGTVSNTSDDDDHIYRMITLGKITDPEARINRSVYYAKLTSAINDAKKGNTVLESEDGNLMEDLEPVGTYYFEYDDQLGKWVSNNDLPQTTASSKLVIDLRNEENDKTLDIDYIINSGTNNLYENYKPKGNSGISIHKYANYGKTTGDTVYPYYQDYYYQHYDENIKTIYRLKKGEIYILSISYQQPYTNSTIYIDGEPHQIYVDGEYTLGNMYINNITLADFEDVDSSAEVTPNIYVNQYGFYYDSETDTIRSNNQYVCGDSYAYGYSEIDLTDKEGEYDLIVNASMETYYDGYYHYANVFISEDNLENGNNTTVITYRGDYNPEIKDNFSGSSSGFAFHGPNTGKVTLQGGKKYYLKYKYERTFSYRDHCTTEEEYKTANNADQFIIKSIDLVKKTSDEKTIDLFKTKTIYDYSTELSEKSDESLEYNSEDNTITTRFNNPNQVASSYVDIDLTDDDRGLIFIMDYNIIKGTNNSNVTTNYNMIQYYEENGEEKQYNMSYSYRSNGLLYALPGGYRYKFTINISSPTNMQTDYPKLVISKVTGDRFYYLEGNNFNGIYDYGTSSAHIFNNSNYYVSNKFNDSYIKIDLTSETKDQLLTFNTKFNDNSYGERYYIYLTDNNRAVAPSDLYDNRQNLFIYEFANNGYTYPDNQPYYNFYDKNLVLEKGKIYYLHFASMTGSVNDYKTSDNYGYWSFHLQNMKLTSIDESLISMGNPLILSGTIDVAKETEARTTITPRQTSELNVSNSSSEIKDFVYNSETQMYDAQCYEQNDIAAKVFKFDLTEETEDRLYTIITNDGGQNNYYRASEEDDIIPVDYGAYFNNHFYTYNSFSNGTTFKLEKGKIYYVQVITKYSSTPLSIKFVKNEQSNTTNEYETIGDEIRNFNERVDTVQLLKDVSVSSTLNIDYSQEVILDLNGHNLTATNQDYVINNSGDLTVLDSKYEELKRQYLDELAEYKEYAGLCDGCEPSEEYILDHVSMSEYSYSGKEETYFAKYEGDYLLETWGAQGGSYNDTYYGGYGGYSKGVVHLEAGQTLYINVGGQGVKSTKTAQVFAGGYNGGGNAYGYTDKFVGSGGGATHIATSRGLLSTLSENQSSVLIVSGGGGGSGYYNSYRAVGGHAGGYIGNNGSAPRWGATYYGRGGTQTEGGIGYDGAQEGINGSFGQGANSTNNGTGGGGGLYGGGGGKWEASGGGGSGYLSTSLTNKEMYCYNCSESTEEATKTTSTTCVESNPVENCSKKGNGYARITLLTREQLEEDYENLEKRYDIKEEPSDEEYVNTKAVLSNSRTGLINNELRSKLTLKSIKYNSGSTYAINNSGLVVLEDEPVITVSKQTGIGINNNADGEVVSKGNSSIVLNIPSCSTTINGVGIKYTNGTHNLSNISISGKNGIGVMVNTKTDLNLKNVDINITDTCSKATITNSYDYSENTSYDKNFTYTRKTMSSSYRYDGSVYNLGNLNITDATSLVGTVVNNGNLELKNGTSFKELWQIAGNSTISKTNLNIDRIVNNSGEMNISANNEESLNIESTNTPAVINYGTMNTNKGKISSLYNMGLLNTDNTNFDKLFNLRSCFIYLQSGSSDSACTYKEGTANLKGGTINTNQVINENEMTLDGTNVSTNIINRGNLIVKGNGEITSSDKTAILNDPFKLKIYNSSGSIIDYIYSETNVILGDEEQPVTNYPKITSNNDKYAITGNCYSGGNKNIASDFNFSLHSYRYNSRTYYYLATSYDPSQKTKEYPNYSNLCSMDYYDGTIANSTTGDITTIVDIPVSNIRSGYDVLYDNSGTNGIVKLDTIDSTSRQGAFEINGTPYKSLETAINSVSDNTNTTINVVSSIPTANKVTIPENKNITLNYQADLITFSKDALITNNGNLEVTGSGNNKVMGAVAYENNGTLTMADSVTNVNTKGNYFKQSNLLKNNSTAIINNTISNSLDFINNGQLTINGGNYNSNTIYSTDSSTTITGGEYTSVEDSNYNDTIPVISNDNVNHNGIHTKPLFIANNSNILFSNFDTNNETIATSISQNLGKFTDNSTLSLNNSTMIAGGSNLYTELINSTINISGGQYDNYYYLINNSDYNQDSGIVNGNLIVTGPENKNISITKGQIKSSEDVAIHLLDASNTKITVGTKGDLIEGTDDLNVSKTDPLIKGSEYGLASSGTTLGGNEVYFYDGIFKGNSNPLDLLIKEMEDGYDLVYKKRLTPKEKYLDIVPIIYNYTTDKEYYDIQQSFNEANANDELILLKDYITKADTPSLVVPQNKNFKLYLSYGMVEAPSVNPPQFLMTDYKIVPYEEGGEYIDVESPVIEINNKDILNPSTGEVQEEVPFIKNYGNLTIYGGRVGDSINVSNSLTIALNIHDISGARIVTNYENATLNINKVTAVNVNNRDTMFKNAGTVNVNQSRFETVQANIVNNTGTFNFVGNERDTTACYNPTYIRVYRVPDLETAYNKTHSKTGLVEDTIYNSGTMNIDYLNFDGDYTNTVIRNDGTLTLNASTIEQYGTGSWSFLNMDNPIINNNIMTIKDTLIATTMGLKNNGNLTIDGFTIDSGFSTAIDSSGILNVTRYGIYSGGKGVVDTGNSNFASGSIDTYGEAYHGTGQGNTTFETSTSLNSKGTPGISEYATHQMQMKWSCKDYDTSTYTYYTKSQTLRRTVESGTTVSSGAVYVGNNRNFTIKGGGINLNLENVDYSCKWNSTYSGGYYSCSIPYNHENEYVKNYTVSAIEANNATLNLGDATAENTSGGLSIRNYEHEYGIYAYNSDVNIYNLSIPSMYIESENNTINIGVKDGTISTSTPVVGFSEPSYVSCSSKYTKGINFYDGMVWLNRNKICSFNDTEDNNLIVGNSGAPYNVVNNKSIIVNTRFGGMYNTIEDAIANATAGDTLQMISGVSYPKDNYDVIVDKDITIDLHGQLVDVNLIINSGSTTITDSYYKEDNTRQRGIITNITNNTGTLTIDEGTVNNINSNSTLSIAGGNVKRVNTAATSTLTGGTISYLDNSGTLTASNTTVNTVKNTGTLTGTNLTSTTITTSNSLILDGATVTTLNNDEYGSLNISNSTVTSLNNDTNSSVTFGANNTITTFHNKSINPITITDNKINYIYNHDDNGSITINGTESLGIYNAGSLTFNTGIVTYDIYNACNGNAVINGGTIRGVYNRQIGHYNNNYYGEYTNEFKMYWIQSNNNTTMTINGGDIQAVYNRGTLDILGGNIGSILNTSPTYGSSQKAITPTLTIGSKDGNVSVASPLVTNTTGYAVTTSDQSVFNFYDGRLVSSKNLVVDGPITDLETNYDTNIDPDYDEHGDLTGTYSMTLKVHQEEETKIACVNNICYTTLQEAINASVQNYDSETGCPNVIIGDQFFFDVELDDDLVLDPQYTVTIDLNHHNINDNGYNIPENIILINGSRNGSNLQSSLARFLSNVFDSGNTNKDIIITNMEDGNALDTSKTYNLYKYNGTAYLLVEVDSDGAGKYSMGKETTDMKPIKGRLYLNDLPNGEYKLKDNYNNELEFTIYDDGTLTSNVRENIVSEYGHLSASAVATLIISIQTGITRVSYILIILLVLGVLTKLLLMKKNKSKKKETI